MFQSAKCIFLMSTALKHQQTKVNLFCRIKIFFGIFFMVVH